MLELIIVRHGETDSNIKGGYLGWTDVDLNANGVIQAKILSDMLKEEKIDVIYSSPLKRTINTAKSIIDNKVEGTLGNKGIILVDGLKERCFGIWEDLIYSEINEKYSQIHDEWVNDWIDYKIPEGESAREAYERNTRAVDEIILRHSEGKVLIVAHRGVARFIVAHLLGMGIEGSWRFAINNGSITTISITDGFAVLTSLNRKY